MKCQCCKNGWNQLVVEYANIVSCCRNHRFELKIQDNSMDVILEVVAGSDETACKLGEIFPVPKGVVLKSIAK